MAELLGLVLEHAAPLKAKTDVPWYVAPVCIFCSSTYSHAVASVCRIFADSSFHFRHGSTQEFIQVKALPLLRKGGAGFVRSPAGKGWSKNGKASKSVGE